MQTRNQKRRKRIKSSERESLENYNMVCEEQNGLMGMAKRDVFIQVVFPSVAGVICDTPKTNGKMERVKLIKTREQID